MSELRDEYDQLMQDVEARIEELALKSTDQMPNEEYNLTTAQIETLNFVGGMVRHYRDVRGWLQTMMDLCHTKEEPGLAEAIRDHVRQADQEISFEPDNR